jgi:CheY-like chemotaxis protein
MALAQFDPLDWDGSAARTIFATSGNGKAAYDMPMSAQSLVLCRDPDVLRTLCPLLFENNMGVEICLGNTGANRMLRKRKFDAVIVECDSEGHGLDILQQLRADTPNQNTITVGVVDDHLAMKAALATGANFVLSKPISVEDASRILRFTTGLIGRMVRRFLRVAVPHLAQVEVDILKDPAFLLDISEGGIAVQSMGEVGVGDQVEVAFSLPETMERIQATASVVWTDPSGRIGLEFLVLSREDRQLLKTWITNRVKNSPDDAPDALERAPESIRRLSRWMRPLARLIDGTVVLGAAAVFCIVTYLFLRQQWNAALPLSYAFTMAACVGTLLYSSLFLLLDVRFPGTRAMQSLLMAAGTRQMG